MTRTRILIARRGGARRRSASSLCSLRAQPAPTLDTQQKKVSYAIGLNLGKTPQGAGGRGRLRLADARRQGRPGRHLAARRQADRGNHGDVPEGDAGQDADQDDRRRGKKNEDAGKAFLAETEKKPGVQKTASGLLYEIVKAGDGPKPASTDTVKVHYRGTLIDGKEFDSSYKRNQPAVFPVNRVITGWHEALQLMPVGSKWKLYIPSDLAYGPQGAAGGAIPPNAVLLFDVELLSIEKPQYRRRPRRHMPGATMSWSDLERLEQRGPRANPWRAGRSHAVSRRGVVASSHSLATLAGVDCLRRGGTAMDAAITTAAVLGVVEPMMTGIGGDAFFLYYDASTGRVDGFNGSGRSPRRLERSHFDRGDAAGIAHEGWAAVTVPGAVSAWWEGSRRHGRLPFADLLAPAIAYAEEGFPVTEIVHAMWRACEDALRRDPEARDAYLPNGHAPAFGATVRSPRLAESLRIVAAGGAEAFYRGPIAAEIARYARATGGFLEVDDFAVAPRRVGRADRHRSIAATRCCSFRPTARASRSCSCSTCSPASTWRASATPRPSVCT